MYDGDIYKTRNLTNKSMVQMFPDPDDRKRAQDSIQNRLDTFDKNIWVPSREEVIAAREAREAAEAAAEAAAEGTPIQARDGNAEEEATEKKTSRSRRGSASRSSRKKATADKPAKKEKKAKAYKPKAAKSSSSAVRSVRRRK
jgi:restriction endonuclease S subunit